MMIWFQLASGREDAALCTAGAPTGPRAARLAAAVASAAALAALGGLPLAPPAGAIPG